MTEDLARWVSRSSQMFISASKIVLYTIWVQGISTISHNFWPAALRTKRKSIKNSVTNQLETSYQRGQSRRLLAWKASKQSKTPINSPIKRTKNISSKISKWMKICPTCLRSLQKSWSRRRLIRLSRVWALIDRVLTSSSCSMKLTAILASTSASTAWPSASSASTNPLINGSHATSSTTSGEKKWNSWRSTCRGLSKMSTPPHQWSSERRSPTLTIRQRRSTIRSCWMISLCRIVARIRWIDLEIRAARCPSLSWFSSTILNPSTWRTHRDRPL